MVQGWRGVGRRTAPGRARRRRRPGRAAEAVVLVGVLLAAGGCRTPRGGQSEDEAAAGQPHRPLHVAGIVRTADLERGFVVIDFGVGGMPPPSTVLSLQRGGRRVGTVRVVEPVAPPYATAEIIRGVPRPGDLLE